MEELRKDITLWYSKLEGRGKIILALAGVGMAWLLFQLIIAITGTGLLAGLNGIVRTILNVIAITLVALIVAQFFLLRSMMKDARENYKELAMRGRRGGARHEQIQGRRNAGSGRSGRNNNMSAIQMVTGISTDALDKQYRPKPIARPTVIADWSDIEEAGMYALEATPKRKVEIIDAGDIGGGFFVAKYSDGMIKERTFMTHRQSGEPLRFSSLRNAKKALKGGPPGTGKKKRKPKPKKRKR